ncbi:MAG: undecaprenyl-phosphate galactose phosphotransferase WbaP, partial [Aquificota bacterium]
MRGTIYLMAIDLGAYLFSLFLAYAARANVFPRFLPTPKFSFTFLYHLGLWWMPLA